jgi:hypothetical protein
LSSKHVIDYVGSGGSIQDREIESVITNHIPGCKG